MGLGTLAGLQILHPDSVLGMAIERLQGQFVGNFFIPDRPVSMTTFMWYYYGNPGGVTPEVGENDIGPLADTEYEERLGRVKFYKERTRISHFVDPIRLRNVAQDKINFITDRLRLRLEALKVGAITSAAITTVAMTDYYWKDCDTDNSNWIGGTGHVSIMDDIIDGNQRISEYAKMQTDTILVGTRIGAAMRKNIETRDWDRAGPMSVELRREGMKSIIPMPGNIGRFIGHEVFVSNASVLSDPDNPRSAYSSLVSDHAYIFKRGPDLGYGNVFLGTTVKTKEKIFASATETQLSMALGVVVHRPQLIYTVANVI